jgi:hypothetical protein
MKRSHTSKQLGDLCTELVNAKRSTAGRARVVRYTLAVDRDDMTANVRNEPPGRLLPLPNNAKVIKPRRPIRNVRLRTGTWSAPLPRMDMVDLWSRSMLQ